MDGVFFTTFSPTTIKIQALGPGTVKQLGEYLSTNIKDPIISESEDRVTVSGNDDEGVKIQQSCVLDFGDEVLRLSHYLITFIRGRRRVLAQSGKGS